MNHYFIKKSDPTAPTCLCGAFVMSWYEGRPKIEPHHCPFDYQEWLRNTKIDWCKKDKSYWRGLYAQIRKDNITSLYQPKVNTLGVFFNSNTSIKDLQARRHRHRMLAVSARFRDPVSQYGSIKGAWVSMKLHEAMESINDPCIDNSRWARVGNRKDMRRYRKAKAHGCCGSYDEEISSVLFGKFMIGFNYGH